MTTSIARLSAFIAAAAIFSAGCGSNSSDSTTTSDSPTAGTGTSQTSDSGKMAAVAPIPSGLKCSDAIVWVNLSSKAYHMSGDKYYGRSKHGEYECQSTADGKGYHLAGTSHTHTGSHSNGSGQPSPSST